MLILESSPETPRKGKARNNRRGGSEGENMVVERKIKATGSWEAKHGDEVKGSSSGASHLEPPFYGTKTRVTGEGQGKRGMVLTGVFSGREQSQGLVCLLLQSV